MDPERAVTMALEALPGLAGRVFPLEVLKNVPAPFVFYVPQEDHEEDALDGLTGLCSAAIEIHCVAGTYAQLVTLAGAVRPALRALQGFEQDGLCIQRATVRRASPDLKEREVNLYRRMYLLQLHYLKEESS